MGTSTRVARVRGVVEVTASRAALAESLMYLEAVDVEGDPATLWPYRLARARELAGLTQVELADLVGVQPVQVSRWERGSARARVAQRRRLVEVLAPDDDEVTS